MKPENVQPCNLLDPFVFHELSTLQHEIAQHAYMVALAAFQRGLKVRFHYDLAHLDRFAQMPVQGVRGEMFSVTDGQTTRYFRRSMSDLVSKQLSELCNNKQATKEALSRAGVPVPPGLQINSGKEPAIKDFVERYRGHSFLLKPLGGTLGKGVVRDIPEKHLAKEIEKIAGQPHLLEVYLRGHEYRAYVVDHQLVSNFERVPCHVKGNGKESIEALIESHNKVRANHFLYRESLIRYDEHTKLFLNKKGLEPEYIPLENEIVWLNDIPSYMQGGLMESRDPTSQLESVACAATKAVDIPVAGLDIIVCNKGSANEQAYVLEINQCPYLTTAFGDLALGSRPVFNSVADAIIDYHFPGSLDNQRFVQASFDMNSIQHAFNKGGIDYIDLPTLGDGVEHSRIMISAVHTSQLDINKLLLKIRHRGLKVKVMRHGTERFLLDFIGNKSQKLILVGLLS